MTGHGEKLSRKAELFIVALLTQPTVTAAAQTIGVSEATARRWLQREEFQERYREARQEALSQDRKSTRLNSSHIQKSRMPSSA